MVHFLQTIWQFCLFSPKLVVASPHAAALFVHKFVFNLIHDLYFVPNVVSVSAFVMGFVVRLEGLPFRVSKEELLDFFGGCKLPEGLESIHLILNREGRASGLGFVEVCSMDDVAAAEALSRQYIGNHNRYANVVGCDSEELQWYLRRRGADALEAKKYRVRMHGLPFRASEYEIARWFEPESYCCDVEVHLNREGRPSGDATAFFDTEEQAERAMAKDRQEMGGRYINLTKDCTRPLSRAGYFVRMSGLPFRATEQEVKDFFQPEADCVGVRIVYNRDGRPSGDAVAEFESDDQAERAMGRNREHMGSRFIVLTREDAGSNSNSFDSARDGAPSAAGRCVIRMGGLPYRATVRDIMDWFQPEAECVHVRIIMNRDGRPSGEALAEFDSVEQADQAMTKNRQYMRDRFVILTAQY